NSATIIAEEEEEKNPQEIRCRMRPPPTSPSPQEPRHRQAGTIEDGTNRRLQAQRHSKDFDKGAYSPRPDKNPNFRLFYLRLAFILIICGTLVTLLYSPTIDSSSTHLRLWGREFIDKRYVAVEEVDWSQVSKHLASLNKLSKDLKVGLLNFDGEEVQKWKQLAPDSECTTFALDYASGDVKWETLYPEWIDEDEQFEVPKCPPLHLPKAPTSLKLDVVAAKLPCRKWEKNWSRDVARLHLQLAAAKLAAFSKEHTVYVLLITDCWPSPNLFSCKDLISHENNTWFYKPSATTLKSKLKLPVGSCQLSVPLKAK
ncbi:hypothetical protein KI387_035732, partial [Taxus chinensis]